MIIKSESGKYSDMESIYISKLELDIMNAILNYQAKGVVYLSKFQVSEGVELAFFSDMFSNLKFESFEFNLAVNHLLEVKYLNANGSITDLGRNAIKNYHKDRFNHFFEKYLPIWISIAAFALSFVSIVYTIISNLIILNQK